MFTMNSLFNPMLSVQSRREDDNNNISHTLIWKKHLAVFLSALTGKVSVTGCQQKRTKSPWVLSEESVQSVQYAPLPPLPCISSEPPTAPGSAEMQYRSCKDDKRSYLSLGEKVMVWLWGDGTGVGVRLTLNGTWPLPKGMKTSFGGGLKHALYEFFILNVC